MAAVIDPGTRVNEVEIEGLVRGNSVFVVPVYHGSAWRGKRSRGKPCWLIPKTTAQLGSFAI